MLYIEEIVLQNFRCFKSNSFTFSSPYVVIEGDNGSGKTTILEALHYLCYLRSFKTHAPRECVRFDAPSFFIQSSFTSDTINHELSVGLEGNKRLVKLDQRVVATYKDLMDYYRVITINEDDLFLIKGSPEVRRAFLDQSMLLQNPLLVEPLKKYRQILDQRTMLFRSGYVSDESYLLWTEQLFAISRVLEKDRLILLSNLETRVNNLLQRYGYGDIQLSFDYRPKVTFDSNNFQNHIDLFLKLKEQEFYYKRTLFGVHLDDFHIFFKKHRSKLFASRGQQKLIIMLLKIALAEEIGQKQGPPIMLLDDFMTDFDQNRLSLFFSMLKDLNTQCIFTIPTSTSSADHIFKDSSIQKIALTE